ncbi:MAG: hypothetical protein V1929_00980 [bacterium]
MGEVAAGGGILSLVALPSKASEGAELADVRYMAGVTWLWCYATQLSHAEE